MNKNERLKLLKWVGKRVARKRCAAAHAAIDLGQEVVRVRRTILKECSECGKEFDPSAGKYRGVCSDECAKKREAGWRQGDKTRKKERNEAMAAERRKRREERHRNRMIARRDALFRAFGRDPFTIGDAVRALGLSETPISDSLEALRGMGLVTRTKMGMRGAQIRWLWKLKLETNPSAGA